MLSVSAAAVWGLIGVAGAINESLWLDELHSTWTANAPLGEISSRAAMGNQLSPYFWLLWLVSQTAGTAEAVWRAPSVVAWLATIALAGAWLTLLARRLRRPQVLAALALIVCDRAQLFYATEARPYALLSLVSLGAWLTLGAWSRDWFPAGAAERRLSRWWFAWCGLNALAFWLQPIAVLSIAAQFAYLVGLVVWHRASAKPRRSRAGFGLWPIAVGGVCLALAMLPATSVLSPVWEHRQQWAGFAAKHAFSDVLELLPFAALLSPLLAGWLWSSACGLWGQVRRQTVGRACEPESNGPPLAREWWMWACAWCVPCCLVYGLTASGLAPLMHRRYVFLAAFPWVLWVAWSWSCLPSRAVRACVLLSMLGLLLYQQGSFQAWRRGSWPTAVRGEDWRGAVQWLNSRSQSESSNSESSNVVFCASNLIEGARAGDLDAALENYLTLPLQSIYALRPARAVRALANDPQSWPSTLRATLVRSSLAPSEIKAWLVVRSSAKGLQNRLRASGLIMTEHGDFGGVQVARVRLR